MISQSQLYNIVPRAKYHHRIFSAGFGHFRCFDPRTPLESQALFFLKKGVRSRVWHPFWLSRNIVGGRGGVTEVIRICEKKICEENWEICQNRKGGILLIRQEKLLSDFFGPNLAGGRRYSVAGRQLDLGRSASRCWPAPPFHLRRITQKCQKISRLRRATIPFAFGE